MLWTFLAVGRSSLSSSLSTFCWTTLCTSTVGEAPETVIVSSTAPTRSSAFTVAVNEPVSSMPSRTTVVKPARVKVTVYRPGRRSTIWYRPCESVVALRTFSISTGTGRFDGDAGNDGARRISDGSGNADDLGRGGGPREGQREYQRDPNTLPSHHGDPPVRPGAAPSSGISLKCLSVQRASTGQARRERIVAFVARRLEYLVRLFAGLRERQLERPGP